MAATFRFCHFLVAGTLTALLCVSSVVSGADGCGPFSTIPAHSDYSGPWWLRWDPENPAEMAAGTSVQISVQGGMPDYSWQMRGEGFSLESNSTGGVTNTLSAAADICGTADITVTDLRGQHTGGHVTVPGPALEWDQANNFQELPGDGIAVPVFVNGGRSPFSWQVSDGFQLGCEGDCGRSNTVVSLGTDCVGTVTVIDACGSEVEGFVRRPGQWSTAMCYRYKATLCYPSQECGDPGTYVVANHKVRVSCCRVGATAKTGICAVDGWEFTAEPSLCPDVDYRCPTNAKVWSLYIYPWVCD